MPSPKCELAAAWEKGEQRGHVGEAAQTACRPEAKADAVDVEHENHRERVHAHTDTEREASTIGHELRRIEEERGNQLPLSKHRLATASMTRLGWKIQ